MSNEMTFMVIVYFPRQNFEGGLSVFFSFSKHNTTDFVMSAKQDEMIAKIVLLTETGYSRRLEAGESDTHSGFLHTHSPKCHYGIVSVGNWCSFPGTIDGSVPCSTAL